MEIARVEDYRRGGGIIVSEEGITDTSSSGMTEKRGGSADKITYEEVTLEEDPSDGDEEAVEGGTPQGCYIGEVCGDRYGGEGTNTARLRRCGWAAVQVKTGKPSAEWQTSSGKLAGPKQTVPRAELRALPACRR